MQIPYFYYKHVIVNYIITFPSKPSPYILMQNYAVYKWQAVVIKFILCGKYFIVYFLHLNLILKMSLTQKLFIHGKSFKKIKHISQFP